MSRITPIILASLLIGGLSSIAQSGNAGAIVDGTNSRSYVEDFEGYLSGQTPGDSWLALTATGSGSNQAYSPAPTGSAVAWRIDDTAVGYAAQLRNTAAGVNICTSGQTFTFAFNLATPPTLGSTFNLRLQGTGVDGGLRPLNTIGVELAGVSGAETLTSFVRGSSGDAAVATHTAAYTGGTTVTIAISQVNCSGVGASALFTYSGAFTAVDRVTDDAPIAGDLDRFNVDSNGTLASGTSLYVDNLAWHGAPFAAPTISTLTPTQGLAAGGNQVTITGTGFRAGATATFGGSAATITAQTATTLNVTTPPHAVATVDVVVTNPDGQSATKTGGFRYNPAPAPVITARSPSSGPVSGGNVVNITGTNFAEGVTVTFASIDAVSVTRDSSTAIRAVAPPRPAGSATLAVCNPDAQCDTATYAYIATAPTEGGGNGSTGSTGYQNVDESVIADSGLGSDIHVNGDIIAIAHKTSGNVVLLTYSTDGGTTWIDKGLAGLTTTNPLKVQAFNASTFAVIYGPRDVYRTTNGGNDWTYVATPLYNFNNPCCLCYNLGTSGAWAADASETTIVVITTQSAGFSGNCGGGQVAGIFTYSLDGGATWTAAGGGAQGVLAVDIDSLGNWRQYYNSGGAPAFIEVTNGVITGSGPVRDSFTGTYATLTGFTIATEGGRYAAFKSGSETKVAIPVGANNWLFKNAGTSASSHARIATGVTATRLVQSMGAGLDSISLWSAPYGETFAGTAIQGSGPTEAQPSIYADCDDIWVAGRNQASNSLAVYHEDNPETCTAPPAPDETAGAAVAHRTNVTGIVGFDVDDNGGTVVLRTAAGNDVRTLVGATLVDSSPIVDTNCGNTEGVMAQRSISRSEDIIGYLHCTTPNDVSQVRIRASDLTRLDLPGYCNDDCEQDVDDEDTAEPEDDLYELRGMAGFPFDYSAHDTSGTNSIYLSWGFSTDDGRIGVNTITYNNVDRETSFAPMKKLMHSGQPVDQLCTARDDNKRQDYIYGMQSNGQVSGFTVSYQKVTSNPNSIIPLMTNVFGGIQTARPSAIACAQDRVFVLLYDGSAAIYRPNSPDLWKVSNGSASTVSRAATMSPDGSYGAYIADGLVRFFRVIDGSPIGSISAPPLNASERFVGMELTKLGQALFIATTNNVYRYDTAELVGTDGVRPCDGCNRDNDPVPDERDPDIDGDGLLNNEDPDIDGDGRCNAGTGAKPAGTEGASGGCSAVESDDPTADDDGDGIANSADTSPHGPGGSLPPGSHVPCGVPNFPACGSDGTNNPTSDSGSGVARIFNRFSESTQFLIGLVIVGIVAGIAYYLAGPAPMVVGGAATLGICAAVALGLFGIWVPITIGASGIAAFAAAMAKKVGGART